MTLPRPSCPRGLFALLLLPLALAAHAATTRPNIIFLFADDQRYDTLGCAGHPIVQTPTIDRLAADGVRFSNAFVTTSVCWVSRAVVLTGQWARTHAQRNAIPTVSPQALRTMLPLQLRAAGYRTAHFGKWHMVAPNGFNPAEQYDQFEAIGRNPYLKPMPDGSKRHETDLVCDRGVAFIQAQKKDQPFSLHLWFNAAHAEDNDRRPGIGHYPWPPALDGLYEDKAIAPPRLSDPAIVERHPAFLNESINRQRFFWGYDTPEKYQTNVRAYLRMITGIDRGIARVLAALREAGLAENTVIVYSADNGYYLGDRGFQGKWSHYEESLRVPLIIYDPRLPQAQRGRVVNDLVLNVDLPATFLDWAGAAKPASYEGRSLAPLVEGRAPGDWRRHFFCEHLDLAPTLTWEGVRGERFVYARYFDQEPAYEFLHDLEADPDQLRNLALDPAQAETLRTWRALCDAEMNARGGALLPLSERGGRKSPATKKGAAKKAGE
ncbi:sulfatase family protein [Horticoccus sp. 23ND18S-11]|uniref:sulfatase family protein n=1 Tax=Horticoccus sp. 23ND18S-11 TaxID=3391832 RepID=UPI0039C956E2